MLVDEAGVSCSPLVFSLAGRLLGVLLVIEPLSSDVPCNPNLRQSGCSVDFRLGCSRSDVAADTSKQFVARGLRIVGGLHDTSTLCIGLLVRDSRSTTFGRPNNQDDGCDEQQLRSEFHPWILYRPTNTGSASLCTCGVPVRAMTNQVLGEAEAY